MVLPCRRRDGWGRSWRVGLLSRVCGGPSLGGRWLGAWSRSVI
ncbi:MAG: hypothetical protein ACK6AD_11565 [Cyanobacteriota bacterium]